LPCKKDFKIKIKSLMK